MTKKLMAAIILVAYTITLIRVIVFKEFPVVRIGSLILHLGGSHEGRANLVPFKSILPYLLLKRGLMISLINLAGNILLFLPIGFLTTILYRPMSRIEASIIALVFSFAIEITQHLLRVGIFDIDDVILNSIGVLGGWWIYNMISPAPVQSPTLN